MKKDLTAMGKALVLFLTNTAKLIKIDSIVTLATTGVVAYMALTGTLEGPSATAFLPIYMIIIKSYFDKKANKEG